MLPHVEALSCSAKLLLLAITAHWAADMTAMKYAVASPGTAAFAAIIMTNDDYQHYCHLMSASCSRKTNAAFLAVLHLTSYPCIYSRHTPHMSLRYLFFEVPLHQSQNAKLQLSWKNSHLILALGYCLKYSKS